MKTAIFAAIAALAATAPSGTGERTGADAAGDWTTDAPGVIRKITATDMPGYAPGRPGVAPPSVVPRPVGAQLNVPPGYQVAAFADLDAPRQIRTAPNGDLFVAETDRGAVRVLRAPDGATKPTADDIFAQGLAGPFGIAFYPPGASPQWVYVANVNSVVRFPYRSGDMKARGPAQVVVAKLTESSGGHSTRDVAFSPDGRRMFVSVGSGSNDAESMPKKTLAEARAWDAAHGLGATWGKEEDRADVLVMAPDGKGRKVYAAGIRNCVSLTVQPRGGALWCVTNERDMTGDNLPTDYATRVREGAFYGWPWYYIGAHEDYRHAGERPDLAGRIAVPDVLFQAHSAPLGMTFYEPAKGPAAFPAADQGAAFVTLHGSWNRARRTGYKLVKLIMKNGAPTGQYEDFLVGFVVDAKSVWGRPVGVAEAHDGALLVTDDGGGTVWRISRAQAAGGKK